MRGAEAARGSGDPAPWWTAREGAEGSQSREFGAAALHSAGVTEFFLPASFSLRPHAGRGQAGGIRVQSACGTPEG